MSASFSLPVETVLSDGTYLSQLRPARKKDGPPLVVRVIEYSVITENDDGEQVSELFCLATTLLDPQGPQLQTSRASTTTAGSRDRYR